MSPPRYLPERAIGANDVATIWLARDTRGAWCRLDRVHPDLLEQEGTTPELPRWRARCAAAGARGLQPLLDAFEETRAEDHDAAPRLDALQPQRRLSGVSPWIDGETLDRRWRRLRRRGERLAAVDAARIVWEVALGLEALAAADPGQPPFIYGQLGPDDIRVDALGRAYLQAAPTTPIPRIVMGQGRLISSFNGIPPELVRGLPATPAADVYRLGLVLYTLLTGQLPFLAPSNLETLEAIIRGSRRSISDLAPEVDPKLAALGEAALALHPEERIQEIAALRHALEAWLGERRLDEAERLDEAAALTWARERLAADDPAALRALFLARPDLAASQPLRDYAAHHVTASLTQQLRAGLLPPWPLLLAAAEEPEALDALRVLRRRERLPAGGALVAGWLLMEPDVSLPLATRALAPERPAHRAAAQPLGPVAISPCAMRWEELQPLPGRDDARRCDRCQKEVTRARSLGELIGVVQEGCAYYAPEER